MFGWIRGRSEDLDYTLRSATILLHSPAASLLALSLPLRSVATEMASELGWGRCSDTGERFTPRGQVWYNKPASTATAQLVDFIGTNLGIASNTLHGQSWSIFLGTGMPEHGKSQLQPRHLHTSSIPVFT